MEVKDLSLDVKLGQMITAGFPSEEYDDHLGKLIDMGIGNIILFSRNTGSKDKLVKLNEQIQKNVVKKTGIPAFISVDQEGGTVTRVHDGVTVFPGNMAVAASGSEADTYSQGEITARELRNLGINLVLAPVLDVNNNPNNPVIGVRSYGDNPEIVSRFGCELIKGLQAGGAAATAKHFPGHGDVTIDSHLDLPCIDHSRERLMSVELPPFIKAIEAGVDFIMSAHILFPAIENEKLPATLSYKVLTGLLREKFNFNGVIMTDCLEMKAIADYYGAEKAAVMAVKAGADMLCISHTLEYQRRCLNALKKAVLDGEIKIERIDASVQRILDKKRKHGLFEAPFTNSEGIINYNNRSENISQAEKISRKSITVIKDENNLIPLSGKTVFISTDALALTGAENTLKRKVTFAEGLADYFKGEGCIIKLRPENDDIQKLKEKCKEADRVVIGVYDASRYPEQVKLVREIAAVNSNVIAAVLRNPYDLGFFEDISTLMCLYEYTDLSIRSAVKVFEGSIKPSGQLPVKI